jgi:hypothetical protein|tara:strand:- start:83 stop:439 length:357 start_codon:yes stop_codon:yes gene_type:complete
MEGAIDLRLLLSLGAILVSVVAASAIVKQKLSSVIIKLDALQTDYESRLRALNRRTDKLENLIDLNQQRTDVISHILSPAELARANRESARLIEITESNSLRISKIEALHNGRHPAIE